MGRVPDLPLSTRVRKYGDVFEANGRGRVPSGPTRWRSGFCSAEWSAGSVLQNRERRGSPSFTDSNRYRTVRAVPKYVFVIPNVSTKLASEARIIA